MGWNGSGEYSPNIDPPMDLRPEPGVDKLIVYMVVADDLAVLGWSMGSAMFSMGRDGLGDLDRSLVMADPGVAIVSPGDQVHSGMVAGVAVGEETQDEGDPFSLRG